MAVPSNIITASGALDFIRANPGLSVAELQQLAAQMSVDLPGAQTILLYSGGLETNGSTYTDYWSKPVVAAYRMRQTQNNVTQNRSN
jgi:hypothetical protein